MVHLTSNGSASSERSPLTDDASLLASPEVTADQACEVALNALDTLAVLTASQDTAHLVWANKIFVGQIVNRANTLGRLLMAQKVNHG